MPNIGIGIGGPFGIYPTIGLGSGAMTPPWGPPQDPAHHNLSPQDQVLAGIRQHQAQQRAGYAGIHSAVKDEFMAARQPTGVGGQIYSANPALVNHLIMLARRGQLTQDMLNKYLPSYNVDNPNLFTPQQAAERNAVMQLQQDWAPIRQDRAALQAARQGRKNDPAAFQQALQMYHQALRYGRQNERMGLTTAERQNLTLR